MTWFRGRDALDRRVSAARSWRSHCQAARPTCGLGRIHQSPRWSYDGRCGAHSFCCLTNSWNERTRNVLSHQRVQQFTREHSETIAPDNPPHLRARAWS